MIFITFVAMIIEKINIEPLKNELPSEYADRLGIYYTKSVSIKHKKESGQFFTPTPIANLMASFSFDLGGKYCAPPTFTGLFIATF